jgi:hypothetical protein
MLPSIEDVLTGNESTINHTESSLSAMAKVVETARSVFHVSVGSYYNFH